MYSRLSSALATSSSLRMPNSTDASGREPRSTMLPGGGAMVAKLSFTSRCGTFSASAAGAVGSARVAVGSPTTIGAAGVAACG